MADITEEKKTVIPKTGKRFPADDRADILDPSTLNTATLPETETEAEIERKKTPGEKIFNRVVYTGVGFGVNEASALVMTDQFEHGIGKKWFHILSDKLVSTLKYKEKTQKLIEEGVAIERKISPHSQAANLLMSLSLLTSGTLLVAPMKWMEDHKGYWVKKANHWVDGLKGNKSPEEVAARDAEVAEAIACEPKQSWPSLIMGRTLAVASTMTFGAIMGPRGNNKIKDTSEKILTGAVRKNSAVPAPKTYSFLGKFGANDTFHRYARLTGVETVYCLISSTVLEVSSKMFAKTSPHLKDPELCAVVQARPEQNDEANDTKAITQPATKPSGRSAASIAACAPKASFTDAVSKSPDSPELALR